MGFGGQDFKPEHLEKVRRARAIRDDRGRSFHIQVDGGIRSETAGAAVAAGADVLVSGSGIFGAPDPLEAARTIRRVATA